MKKLFLFLAIITFSTINANAYVMENETSDIDVLQKQGFSRSTLELVDWARYRNASDNPTYTRSFVPKRSNFIGRSYQALKEYVDPCQDDGRFAEHNINFSNTWTGDDTHYSSDLMENRQTDNL